MVVGPGVGMEPRTPQNFKYVGDLRAGLLPESSRVLVPAAPGMMSYFGERNRRVRNLKRKKGEMVIGTWRVITSGLNFAADCRIDRRMLAKVCSAAVNGIEAYPVEVEVNAGYGDTILVIVGLPDAAVKESRDRVMTALSNSGFTFTFGRTTINLAPADVKKEGPSFDLPIAVAMVAASEQMESDQLDNFTMVGELALTGAVRSVKGVLAIALRAREERKVG